MPNQNPIPEMPVMPDVELLDRAKCQGGFNTDVELARAILTNKAAISNVRAGKKKLGLIPKLRCYDILLYNQATQVLQTIFHIEPHHQAQPEQLQQPENLANDQN